MKQKLIFLTILLAALPAFSTEYYVDASRPDDAGAATNWATAKQTLQAAVDLTADGDTVWVTHGVYDAGGATTPGYSLTNRVCITNAITVQSLHGPEVTVIEGSGSLGNSNAVRGVFLTTNAALIGFTITNGCTMTPSGPSGSDDYFGGGVFLVTNAVVSNCVVSGNSAFGGGGVFSDGGGILNNCTLSGNNADWGGGVFCYGGILNSCTLAENTAGIGGGVYCEFGGVLNNCDLIGNTADDGGGIYCDGGGTLNNCTLSGNSVKFRGGGANLYQGGMLSDCTLNGNEADSGGGVYLREGGIVNDCTLSSNLAVWGGGARLYLGGMVSNSMLTGNTADNYGGGIDVEDGGTVNNCILTGNSGNWGGGAYLRNTGVLNNCLVRGNSANYGGGVYSREGGEQNNCTVVGNTATNYAGGSYLRDGGKQSNCIMRENISPDGNDLKSSGSNNVVRSTCSSDGVTNGVDGCITNNPLFVDAANSNFNLQAGSPCINAGNNSYVQGATDLNGRDRILNGTVDMGAYEHLTAYVSDDSGNDANSGQSWTDAKQTIQAAVDLTTDGDMVWVTNGTYSPSSEISVTNAITIQSANGRAVTIVDGGGSNRCFNLSGECFVGGFTIANGTAGAPGAGVRCGSGSVVVSNCTLIGNYAFGGSFGGGLYEGISGGGMYRGFAVDCTFTSNTASWGAGKSEGVASNCTFIGNRGESSGQWGFSSGVGLYAGDAYNCMFISNSAPNSYLLGGGISDGTAINCLFVGNEAMVGGGLYNGDAYNCTFFGNTAFNQGAGVEIGMVYNCVFKNNTTALGTNDLSNSEAYNSCSMELTSGVNGNITNLPLFVDAAGGDFRLMSNSPCINWGNNSVVSNAMDMDGNPRIVEDVVDMGAYEYQGIVGLSDSDGDGIDDDWERQHGGNQNPERVCSNGVNTVRQAYIAGLDPNDPNSKFLTSVRQCSPQAVLEWQPCVLDRVYRVYWTTNLLNGFELIGSNIPWTVNSFTDEVHSAGAGFYKIGVELEDSDGNGGGDDGIPATEI